MRRTFVLTLAITFIPGGGANSKGGRTITYDFAKISKKKLHENEKILDKVCTGGPPDPPLIFMQFSGKIVPNNRF